MLSSVTYILALCVGYLGAKGGPSVRSILASMIAWAMEKSSKHRRETTLQNIIQAYPTSSREWTQSIANESYLNFATCYVELFATRYLSRQQQSAMFSVPAENEISSHVQQGRGAIILSAHIGNWELAVPVTAELLSFSAISIAKTQRNKSINEYINTCRSSDRVRVVPMDTAAKDIVKTLSSGGFVCMMLDQAADPHKDVFVDFFGRPAVTFEAPATLALRFHADIIAAFAIRISAGKYQVHTVRIDTSDIDDTEQGRRELVQRCTSVIEDKIREFPGQWSWQHKRWKYNPSDYPKGKYYESEPSGA